MMICPLLRTSFLGKTFTPVVWITFCKGCFDFYLALMSMQVVSFRLTGHTLGYLAGGSRSENGSTKIELAKQPSSFVEHLAPPTWELRMDKLIFV